MIYFKNNSITWTDASLIWSTDDEVIYSEFYQDTDVTWADDDIFWNQIEIKAPNDYYRDGDNTWVSDDDYWVTSEFLNYFKDATDTWENDDDEWCETVPTTGTVQTPTIFPDTGTHPTDTAYITISCGTFNSTIYYTDDGTTPDKTSLVYTGPILLGKDVTIKAIGIKTEYTDSAVVTAVFTVANHLLLIYSSKKRITNHTNLRR